MKKDKKETPLWVKAILLLITATILCFSDTHKKDNTNNKPLTVKTK